jgi:predicted ester cyclase
MDSISIAHRWFRALNEGSVAPELLALDVTSFVPGSEEGKGRELVLSFVTGLLHVFPDLQHELDSVTACGNRVVVEGVITGTHGKRTPASGHRLGGKNVRFRFCTVVETEGQRIVSYHAYYDQLDLLKQLGESWTPPRPLDPRFE